MASIGTQDTNLSLSQSAVDRLPALVDVVLVQIGRVFRNSASRDGKPSVHAKGTIDQIIPSTNRKFHEALDEIEIEILKAKAVMERDLAKILAERAERERAAGILNSPPSTKGSPEILAEQPPVIVPKGGDIPALEESVTKSGQDIVMLDDALTDHEVAATLSNVDVSTRDDNTGNQTEVTKQIVLSQDKATDQTLNTISVLADVIDNATQLKGQEFDGPFNEPPLGTPTTANIRDATFESMFNDSEAVGAGNEIDFGLDFSADAGLSQDMLNDDPFGEDFTDLNATSTEDINTLLPGLENYVNSGDEFSMMDVPQTTSSLDNTIGPQVADTAGSNTDMNVAAVESNFDDMFFGSGEMGVGDNDDTRNMGSSEVMGDFTEFDDAWFKTDGT